MTAMMLSGGGKLNKTLDGLVKKLGSSTHKVKVGFLQGATYPDGTPVAMVAAIQEFGAPRAGIPSRPFFRSMIKAKSPDWGKQLAAVLKKNDFDPVKTLTLMGLGIEGQLRDSIIATDSPALSPVTLMLRKMRAANPSLIMSATVVAQARAKVAAGESYSGVSTKPLVDTAHLLQSVSSEVT